MAAEGMEAISEGTVAAVEGTETTSEATEAAAGGMETISEGTAEAAEGTETTSEATETAAKAARTAAEPAKRTILGHGMAEARLPRFKKGPAHPQNNAAGQAETTALPSQTMKVIDGVLAG